MRKAPNQDRLPEIHVMEVGVGDKANRRTGAWGWTGL